MVQEIKDESLYSGQDTLFREHAGNSFAKRVVDGPVWFPPKPDLSENVDPVTTAINGSAIGFDLMPKKKYRLIASTDVHFVLSGASQTASVSDIYLPAKTAIMLTTGDIWRYLGVIQATGASAGMVQIVEVR